MSQSVGRALSLLDNLAEGPRTLDQLAERVGVHKSTVLRLLRTLEAHRFVQRDGIRYYRLGTALSKVLISALPEAERRAVAGSLDYPKLTENTITSPDAYLVELSKVAERGYAIDDAEHESFIHCIAAPIR